MCSGSELYHATQHRGPGLHLSPTKLRSGSTRMYTHTYKHTFFRQCMMWTQNIGVRISIRESDDHFLSYPSSVKSY